MLNLITSLSELWGYNLASTSLSSFIWGLLPAQLKGPGAPFHLTWSHQFPCFMYANLQPILCPVYWGSKVCAVGNLSWIGLSDRSFSLSPVSVADSLMDFGFMLWSCVHLCLWSHLFCSWPECLDLVYCLLCLVLSREPVDQTWTLLTVLSPCRIASHQWALTFLGSHIPPKWSTGQTRWPLLLFDKKYFIINWVVLVDAVNSLAFVEYFSYLKMVRGIVPSSVYPHISFRIQEL